MPAVRMISVCAMARVPTTATCWVISDRLAARRKRSLSKSEDDHRDEQDDGRAECRVAVQDVADPAEGRLAVEELLGQVRACGRCRLLVS